MLYIYVRTIRIPIGVNISIINIHTYLHTYIVVLGDDSADEERDWLCDVTFGAVGPYH